MTRLLMTIFIAGMIASATHAQPGQRSGQGRGGPGGGQARGGGGGGPGTAGSSTLERAGLKVGQPVPDITIHDDKGGAFPMSAVKGKYTVITFGCLT